MKSFFNFRPLFNLVYFSNNMNQMDSIEKTIRLKFRALGVVVNERNGRIKKVSGERFPSVSVKRPSLNQNPENLKSIKAKKKRPRVVLVISTQFRQEFWAGQKLPQMVNTHGNAYWWHHRDRSVDVLLLMKNWFWPLRTVSWQLLISKLLNIYAKHLFSYFCTKIPNPRGWKSKDFRNTQSKMIKFPKFLKSSRYPKYQETPSTKFFGRKNPESPSQGLGFFRWFRIPEEYHIKAISSTNVFKS